MTMGGGVTLFISRFFPDYGGLYLGKKRTMGGYLIFFGGEAAEKNFFKDFLGGEAAQTIRNCTKAPKNRFFGASGAGGSKKGEI